MFDGSQPCIKDPEIFFEQEVQIYPNDETRWRYKYKYEREAKKMCGECNFTLQCLQVALEDPELQGIWGGTTPKERLVLRRRSA